MLIITEDHVNVRFIQPDIIHITLHEGGHFTTQLLRELRVVSKVANGEAARNYLITLTDPNEPAETISRIRKKVERIEALTVAIVCPTAAAIPSIHSTTSNTCQVFENFDLALCWLSETTMAGSVNLIA